MIFDITRNDHVSPYALPYLVTTKNLDAFLNALKTAKAPERVTNKFLQNLEFSSSNDRLFIGLLKSLGFTDDSGVPTKRYFAFLDQSQSARILAEAVREAYSDLFAVNVNANELSAAEVKNTQDTHPGEKLRERVRLDGENIQGACRVGRLEQFNCPSSGSPTSRRRSRRT